MTFPDRRRITDQHSEPTGHGISYWRWNDEVALYDLAKPCKKPHFPHDWEEYHFVESGKRWKARRVRA